MKISLFGKLSSLLDNIIFVFFNGIFTGAVMPWTHKRWNNLVWRSPYPDHLAIVCVRVYHQYSCYCSPDRCLFHIVNIVYRFSIMNSVVLTCWRPVVNLPTTLTSSVSTFSWRDKNSQFHLHPFVHFPYPFMSRVAHLLTSIGVCWTILASISCLIRSTLASLLKQNFRRRIESWRPILQFPESIEHGANDGLQLTIKSINGCRSSSWYVQIFHDKT